MLNTPPQVCGNLSNQTPMGWSEDSVSKAMSLGFSCFAIHSLQPSSDRWTLAQLIKFKAQQKPEVLDPFMIIKQREYIYGKCTDIVGQIISPTLVAKRAKREQFLSVERGGSWQQCRHSSLLLPVILPKIAVTMSRLTQVLSPLLLKC